MTAPDNHSKNLIERASQGDAAREQLLVCYRDRLRKMLAFHLDRRVLARVGPSDVVQETLADAARKLDDYLRQRPTCRGRASVPVAQSLIQSRGGR